MEAPIFSQILSNDTLDHLFQRNEDIRQLTSNLHRFFSEIYKALENQSRTFLKISNECSVYLARNLIFNEKNCFFFAKNIIEFLHHFGEDSSTLYNSLFNELTNNLNGLLNIIQNNKKSDLDMLAFMFNEFVACEQKVYKGRIKYGNLVSQLNSILKTWQNSKKDAKSIYNLSLTSRKLGKFKKLADEILIYEVKLSQLISSTNVKQRELIDKLLETISNFRKSYEIALKQLYELSKKHSDALSSFVSLFGQIISDKKIPISDFEPPSWLYPTSCRISFEKIELSKNEESPENFQQEKEIGLFPDFLLNPQKTKDINLIDFSDWVLDFLESVYKTANERRKILKHSKILIDSIASEHETCAKNISKTLKNVFISSPWNVFGEEIFTANEKTMQIFESLVKKLSGFTSFSLIKLGPLDLIIAEIRNEIKNNQTNTSKTLRDHGVVRGQLIKAQRKDNSAVLSQFNIKDLQKTVRVSIETLSKNVKNLIEELNDFEKKQIKICIENMNAVIGQMELYFQELSSIFKTFNYPIDPDYEKLFSKLIATDSKIDELYDHNFAVKLIQLKTHEFIFQKMFDPNTHPIYSSLKIGIEEPEQTVIKQDSNSPNLDQNEESFPEKIEEKNINTSITNEYSPYRHPSNFNSEIESPKLHRRMNKIHEVMSASRINNINSNVGTSSERKKIKNKNSDSANEIQSSKINSIIEKNMNSPHRKKRSTISFAFNKFGIIEDELISEVFSCALMDKMLIQGKLFITNKKLGFHSYFNKSTFIGETKMIIPKEDIKRIEKRYNALIFDNSIAVITKTGELFFTSFVFRDKAYAAIIRNIEPPEQKDSHLYFQQNNNNEQEINNLNNNEENNEQNKIEEEDKNNDENKNKEQEGEENPNDTELEKKIEARCHKIKEIALKDDFFDQRQHKLKIPWTNRVEDVYRIIFSTEIFNFKGQNYHGYWEYLKLVQSEDVDYSITPFNPPPPLFYQNSKNLDQLSDAPFFSERHVEFRHPVRNTGIPFMPKSCPVKEEHKIFWFSDKEFSLNTEVRSEKIPYSDSFYICVQYDVKSPNGHIELTSKFKVVWIKKTIMQSTIEKKVVNETLETAQIIILPAMAEILKHVLNSKEYQEKYPNKKKNKGQHTGEMNKNEENEDKGLEGVKVGEVEELKEELAKIKERLGKVEGKVVTLKNTLFIVGISSLVLLLAWLIKLLFFSE